jgi:hypothetical protein
MSASARQSSKRGASTCKPEVARASGWDSEAVDKWLSDIFAKPASVKVA